jgi:trehalose 6-phosphate synthase
MLTAMRIDPAEAEDRMRRLREHVVEHDVNRWAREYLETLRAA